MSIEHGHTNDLSYFRFSTEHDENPFELYISPEFCRIVQPGVSLREALHVLEREIIRIQQDPYGETSLGATIAADSDLTRIVRAQRAVNTLMPESQQWFQTPLVIKRGFDKDLQRELFLHYGHICCKRENLLEQCFYMNRLKRAWEYRAGDEQKKILQFLPYYGVLRTPTFEYILMAQAPGEPHKDIMVPFAAGRRGKEIFYEYVPGVDLLERPALSILFDGMQEKVSWHDIARKIENILGFTMHDDLAGRNVFYDDTSGVYTIFDQNSQEAAQESSRLDDEVWEHRYDALFSRLNEKYSMAYFNV